MVDLTGAEERRHQREAIVLAFIAGWFAGLERVEHRLHAEQVVTQTRAGWPQPRRSIATLVVSLHLRAEADAETSAGKALEVPRDLRGSHRAARERDRDVRAKRDLTRVLGSDHQRQKRIVSGLRRRDAIEAQFLDQASGIRDRADLGNARA